MYTNKRANASAFCARYYLCEAHLYSWFFADSRISRASLLLLINNSTTVQARSGEELESAEKQHSWRIFKNFTRDTYISYYFSFFLELGYYNKKYLKNSATVRTILYKLYFPNLQRVTNVIFCTFFARICTIRTECKSQIAIYLIIIYLQKFCTIALLHDFFRPYYNHPNYNFSN